MLTVGHLARGVVALVYRYLNPQRMTRTPGQAGISTDVPLALNLFPNIFACVFMAGRSNRTCFIRSRCKTINPSKCRSVDFLQPSEPSRKNRVSVQREISTMDMLLLAMTATIALGIFVVYKVTP